MQSEFLESAEFYNRRYHNFSSYVIFPSFILFLFLIVFSIFAQKEISLTAGATVEPARIIATIQSSRFYRSSSCQAYLLLCKD